MLHASYEILGVAVCAMLIGFWIVKRCIARKSPEPANRLNNAMVNDFPRDQDVEHQELMFLMSQKTDSVLAALARTIEQERQKLGGFVRKPSMTEAIDAFQAAAVPAATHRPPSYDQILPLAQNGMAVATIAHQLQLPKEEVSMIMRLNAA
jgi:hypothetical protein